MFLRYERNCEKEDNEVLILSKTLRRPFTIVSNYFRICSIGDFSQSADNCKTMCIVGRIIYGLGEDVITK